MFTIIKSYKQQYSKEYISLDKLYDLIKNNPQKELIERIRSVEYKSTEYINLKSKLNCITPHGIFNNINNKGLVSLSKYLFFEIDNFDTNLELNDTIKRLIDTFPISFVQKSVSNRGFHFFIKYDDTNLELNDTNFTDIHNYVSFLLVNGGFNIDKSAKGLVRRMIISSDQDVYMNKEVSLGINVVSLNTYLNNLNKTKKLKEVYDITLDDTIEKDIIPFKELCSQIKIKKEYNKEIKGDWVIEDMESYMIIIPEKILDGQKHSTYTRIINALYYINEDGITRNQIYSYLHHINNRLHHKMSNYKLKKLVEFVCSKIEEDGEIRIKTRTKKIHFNPMSDLTKKQKQNMGAQISAKSRRNKTISEIQSAKDYLLKQNITPTQSKVKEITGFGIATIKRNWNVDIFDLNDISIIEDKERKEIKLDQIDEEQFFSNTEIVKHKYKGFKEVSIERSENDKELFKSVLNDIKNEYVDIPESILILTLKNKYNWDEYKIDYFYTNYIKYKKDSV